MGNAERDSFSDRSGRTGGRGLTASGRDGFTLLELIVSMTVLGLVVAVLYGSLYVGLRSVDASREKGDVFQRVRIAHEVIGRALRSAYLTPSSSDWTVFLGEEFFGEPGSRPAGEEEEQGRIAFRGEDGTEGGRPSDRMSFDAFADCLAGSRVLASLRIQLSDPDEGGERDLLMVRRPLYGPCDPDTVMLAAGVSGLDIRYLQVDEEGGAQWVDEWDSQAELPQAVEIRIGWGTEETAGLRIADLPLLFYLPERPVR